MGAPAGHAGAGEERRIHILGQTEHVVNEAGIHVDVGAHGDPAAAAGHDFLNAHLLDALHEDQVVRPALLLGEGHGIVLDDDGAGVGHRVDRVAEAVDLAGAVAGAAVEQAVEIVAERGVGRGFAELAAHGAEHLHRLGVGAAVERALERADRAGDGAVGIGAGGADRAADKGGVIGRVLGVQDHHEIEQACLLDGILLVLAEHAQIVFGQAQAGLGVVHIERLAVDIVPLRLIGVGGDERKARDEFDGLAREVLHGGVVRVVVIGIEVRDAAGELVHDVVARVVQDVVLLKALGQKARLLEQEIELLQLIPRRQVADEQEIGDLLIAEGSGLLMGGDDVLHADAAVIELAGHGLAHAVLHIIALHGADVAHAGDDAGAVGIAQAVFDAGIVAVQRRDLILRGEFGIEGVDFFVVKLPEVRHGGVSPLVLQFLKANLSE